MTTDFLILKEKKSWSWKDCSCSKRKGRKPTLIPAEMKMVAAALLLQKTPQTFENYLKGRDHVCMVLPYPFSDITMQHSNTTELFYMLILKICHAINTVDPTFVSERDLPWALLILVFQLQETRYLCLRFARKRSVDVKMVLKTVCYYSGADDNFLCWPT